MQLSYRLVQLLLGSLLSFLVFTTGFANVFNMPAPGNDIVGHAFTVRAGTNDSLVTIGNRYNIGIHEMLAANPNLHLNLKTAHNQLEFKTKVVVPDEFILPPFRQGIVVNIPELRLYYFSPDGQYVYTYPVSLGRMNWATPLTASKVIKKIVQPSWRVPKSIHDDVLAKTGQDLPAVIPPGPNNPLGHFALYLNLPGYLIHGTNQPWNIGQFVSSGCIRMFNEDVAQLYSMVTLGTPVHIINYANKAGWNNGQLYLESLDPIQLDAPPSDLNVTSIDTVLNMATQEHPALVDMTQVAAIIEKHRGIPEPIGSATDTKQTASLSQ